MSAPDEPDEWACPRCDGHGWIGGDRNVWSADFKTLIHRAQFPECEYCNGTAVVTAEQWQTYHDMQRDRG